MRGKGSNGWSSDDGWGYLKDTSWMEEGNCKDLPPNIFFPSDGAGVEVARRICASCPVRMACLDYALENHIDHGVWGGESERERRRIARRRRLDAHFHTRT